MIKLQKRYAYTYKGKDHYKHIITIPEDVIQRLGWRDGIEIEQKVQDNRLMFTLPKRNAKEARFET